MIDLKTIVDNIPIAIFVVNRENKILLANRAAQKIHNVDLRNRNVHGFGDVVGCRNATENDQGCGFSKFCYLCHAMAMVDRAFADQKSISEFETNISTCSAGVRNLRISVTYTHINGQETLEQAVSIVTVEDLTELKKKERLAVASETIGAICHELNQPLQAIIGHVELLTKFQLEDGAISRIEQIFSEMERIKSINIKLMNLTHYQTKPYLSTNILDVDRSTG
jgi:nitrogen-specific signal transduction histidine kinase